VLARPKSIKNAKINAAEDFGANGGKIDLVIKRLLHYFTVCPAVVEKAVRNKTGAIVRKRRTEVSDLRMKRLTATENEIIEKIKSNPMILFKPCRLRADIGMDRLIFQINHYF
jgi:hypothetical protein